MCVKYLEVTSLILTEATQRKSFANNSASDAYLVQGSANLLNSQRRSYSWPSSNQRSQSKSKDNQIYNYYKKPRHIKADWRALKAKNDKAQQADNKGGWPKEVNYIDSSAEVLTNHHNILSIENLIE